MSGIVPGSVVDLVVGLTVGSVVGLVVGLTVGSVVGLVVIFGIPVGWITALFPGRE
jgi:hypothetical protein